MTKTIIISAPAFFWDGTIQLPGVLELHATELLFQFDDFKHSHLNLRILLSDIKSARPFRIFNIAKNGLRIDSCNEKVDLFVLEDCNLIHEAIVKELKKSSLQ